LSHLSTKSSENLKAADLLIASNCFAPSVHCSYYAMLQHMTCKLCIELKMSFEQFANNSEEDERTSHKYLHEEVIRALTIKANKLPELKRNLKLYEFRSLKTNIKILKALRIESDYKDVEINKDLSESALKSSKHIISELDKHFA
jgi:hypothetical protein